MVSAESLERNKVLEAAHSLTRTIDTARFGQDACVFPPMITGDSVKKKKWVLRYNNDGYYLNLPTPFLRLRGATAVSGAAKDVMGSYNSHLGIGPGLFMLDSSTYVDPRRTMGYPLLHALYLMPGNDYSNLSSMNWQMDSDAVLSNKVRNQTNISGVDLITIRSENWDKLEDRDGLEVMPTWIPSRIDPQYLTLINRNSYGMAFLATKIVAIEPSTLMQAEQKIKQYFRDGLQQTEIFRETVGELTSRLATLKERHSVFLERNVEKASLPPSGSDGAGHLIVRGIIGPRAAFSVNCMRSSCLFGFNTAAVSGWHAFVDGQQVDKERVNFAFLGVEVPNGEHEILFLYAPNYLVAGEFVTLCAFLFLLLSSLAPRKLSVLDRKLKGAVLDIS